eukprot:TRINITY_DN3467_c0_g3_i1.p1 TRINITY_DN3467_c0_g3~~TRINITY_DN3467_c0_g3_i1.p1  ORF type:complete len:217 (+),score=43.32 TRINITY_DN3467_c0_g3_i1:42-692(+)
MGSSNSRLPTAEEAATASEIVKETSIAVDATEHRELLKELYEGMQKVDPVEGEFDTTSDVWKRWGFQSRDPCSDFRGGGLATLKWFIWLTCNAPETLTQICKEQRELRASQDAKLGFPVFAAAISVLRASLVSQKILSLGVTHPVPTETASPSWGIHPYQCALVLLQLTSQTTIKKQAQYMEFNFTLKGTQEVLDAALKKGPKTVSELMTLCRLQG